MKKIIAICLSAILLCSTMVFAFATDNPTIEVSTLAAAPGEQRIVTVYINNNPGFNTFSLGFQYDTTRLSLDNVQLCDGVPGQLEYTKKAVWLNSNDIDYSGEFLDLYFTVLEDAAPGEAFITVTYNAGDICNYDEEDINFGILPGSIEVTGEGGGNETTEISYGLTSATAIAGSTVTLYASIYNNPGIISLRNQITYDESVMTLVAVNDLQLLGGYTEPSPDVLSPYTLRWADALATENNTASGQIAELIFEINEDATADTYEVSVNHIEARSVTGDLVDFASATAAVTVSASVTKGDVNLDGEVNEEDSELLNKYLAGWNEVIDNAQSDIDEDGEVTDWDAILLERYINGWDVAEFA